jgi:hypothetical protein
MHTVIASFPRIHSLVPILSINLFVSISPVNA